MSVISIDLHKWMWKKHRLKYKNWKLKFFFKLYDYLIDGKVNKITKLRMLSAFSIVYYFHIKIEIVDQ